MRTLDAYWALVAGNIWAMPLQAVITAAATLALARPGRRLWHRLVGERPDMADVRRALSAVEARAAAAHRIAADLFERHTGDPHPDAPEERM